MNQFDFIEFNKNLQKDFNDSASVIQLIENDEWQDMHSNLYNNEQYEFDDGYYSSKVRLKEILESIQLKLEFAYEFLGLDKMSGTLHSELEEFKGGYEKLVFIDSVNLFYSPVEWILKKHLSAMTSHISLGEESKYETTNSQILLERILDGTGKMLTDRNVEPSNEAEVRVEVYKTLIHVFPDTVREVPIAKISKTYKPDIGVKRLKSAIEYKFVDSEIEAKTAIGGIFEDINGYEGSADWTTFYAVFYMTDNFLTKYQIEEEFKLSDVPHRWKPIVVFGKGSRKNKKDI